MHKSGSKTVIGAATAAVLCCISMGATAQSESSDSVAEIVLRPEIREAFNSIEQMDEANVERLIVMTEIPAPPFEEAVRAADLVTRLKAAGLDSAHIDDAGNVIARRSGRDSNKTIAFVAHIDTVFPPETPIAVRREGNVLFAPGISDNTRALVALLTVVEVMNKHGIQTRDDIVFVGSVGEEGLGDLRGVRHLFGDHGIKIDSFIAMDGGRVERLVVDGVGSNRYRIEFHGPGGHSYGAFGRAHPHQALGVAIERFTKRAERITRGKTKATFSVGRIGGGTSINSIPFSSWMEVDMRSVDPNKVAALDAALRDSVSYALKKENKRRTEGAPMTVTIEAVGKRPAGIGDRNSQLVRNASEALRAVGIEPELTASSTDSNIAISKGIPAVTIARGGISRNAHSLDESWENVDPHLAIQSALLLLAAEAGLIDEL